jgi:hypothetical protein
VESAPRAYRLKASNAAPSSSTSTGTIPLEARGISICKIMVDPKEYNAYCEARGMSPSVATLGNFVMELSGKR